MSLPHVILGMLSEKPQSGYELKKQLETTIIFFWQTDISRIYRTLDDMRQKGWVEFETVVQEDSPNKKIYALTAAGRDELKAWLAEPGKHSGTRNPFLAQLHFSGEISLEAQLHVIEVRLAGIREGLAELERRAARLGLPVPLPADALQAGVRRQMVSLEYGIRRYRFEIEWAENFAGVLRRALAAERGAAGHKG